MESFQGLNRLTPSRTCVPVTALLFELLLSATPGGALLHVVDRRGVQVPGLLPYDVTPTALERTADWYRVDYHGAQGWISANYVTTLGACG